MLVSPSLASPGSPLFQASHTISPRHADPMMMFPAGMYPPEYMMMPGDGTMPLPPLVSPSGNFSQGLCYTFRDTGTCKYGNSCKFAHLPTQHFFAPPIPYVTSPLLSPQEDGYHQPAPHSAGICYQWRDTGTCSYGDTCKFDHHDTPEDGNKLRHGEVLTVDSMTPTSQPRSVASTPRFRDNMLTTPSSSSGSSGSSPLSSFSSHTGTPPLPSKKPICYQWRDSGVCKFGDNCKFGHYKQKQHLNQELIDAMSNMSFQSHLIPIVNPHYHDEEDTEQQPSQQQQQQEPAMSPIQPLTTPIMIPQNFTPPAYFHPISPMQGQPFYYQPTPPPPQQPMYQPTLCVPFLQTGACRFGDRCRYQHTQPVTIIDPSELAAQQAYAISLQQQQQYQAKLKKIQG